MLIFIDYNNIILLTFVFPLLIVSKNPPVFRKYGVRQFIKKVEEDILA